MNEPASRVRVFCGRTHKALWRFRGGGSRFVRGIGGRDLRVSRAKRCGKDDHDQDVGGPVTTNVWTGCGCRARHHDPNRHHQAKHRLHVAAVLALRRSHGRENIKFFSQLYNVLREQRPGRRDWVLEMAGLTDHRRRLTAELPLGWKQRLALGCAVLHEPPILFLDEPTSGVDPISHRNFWELIYALAEHQTTVFSSPRTTWKKRSTVTYSPS